MSADKPHRKPPRGRPIKRSASHHTPEQCVKVWEAAAPDELNDYTGKFASLVELPQLLIPEDLLKNHALVRFVWSLMGHDDAPPLSHLLLLRSSMPVQRVPDWNSLKIEPKTSPQPWYLMRTPFDLWSLCPEATDNQKVHFWQAWQGAEDFRHSLIAREGWIEATDVGQSWADVSKGALQSLLDGIMRELFRFHQQGTRPETLAELLYLEGLSRAPTACRQAGFIPPLTPGLYAANSLTIPISTAASNLAGVVNGDNEGLLDAERQQARTTGDDAHWERLHQRLREERKQGDAVRWEWEQLNILAAQLSSTLLLSIAKGDHRPFDELSKQIKRRYSPPSDYTLERSTLFLDAFMLHCLNYKTLPPKGHTKNKINSPRKGTLAAKVEELASDRGIKLGENFFSADVLKKIGLAGLPDAS